MEGAIEPAAVMWDATDKAIKTGANDETAKFTFTVKNQSTRSVTIFGVEPSCGCTVVDWPNVRWELAPGSSRTLVATIDLHHKGGDLEKALRVSSSIGTQTLTMRVTIPSADGARERNREIALADRQAVFRGDCARCHVAPSSIQGGADLFMMSCAVCHVSPYKASMVPDLSLPKEHRDADFWRTWIAEGRAGSLMPAFSAARGGPFTKAQIEALVEFALHNLPVDPPGK